MHFAKQKHGGHSILLPGTRGTVLHDLHMVPGSAPIEYPSVNQRFLSFLNLGFLGLKTNTRGWTDPRVTLPPTILPS